MAIVDNTPLAKERLVKHSGDKRKYSMDFSKLLTSSATLSSPSVSSTLIGKGSSDLSISDTTVSGQTVTFFIDKGKHSKRYHVKVSVSASSGETLTGLGLLAVKDR